MKIRNILSTLMLLLATLPGMNVQAAEVRIAVAAEGSTADAAVSTVAARAPHILIFDAQGKLLSAQSNPAARLSGGAGPALARWLAEQRVTLLLAVQCAALIAPYLVFGSILVLGGGLGHRRRCHPAPG